MLGFMNYFQSPTSAWGYSTFYRCTQKQSNKKKQTKEANIEFGNSLPPSPEPYCLHCPDSSLRTSSDGLQSKAHPMLPELYRG